MFLLRFVVILILSETDEFAFMVIRTAGSPKFGGKSQIALSSGHA
jgi:hypothetical protein